MTSAPRDRRNGAAEGSEDGFTLIEMVIAIVLLGLIMGALSMAFVTSMKLSASTTQRAKESNDAQLIAGFFVSDAQAAGATNPTTGDVDATYGVSINDDAGCAVPSGNLPVLRLKWRDRATAATSHDNVAVYYYASPVGTQSGQLVRQTCVDGTTVSSTTTLARNIPTKPIVTCSPDCNGVPSLPNTVSMTVSEVQTTQPYTLTASTRPQGQATPNETGTPAPLVLLGNDTCSATAPLSGNANTPLKVFGNVFLEGGGAGCDAYTLDQYTTTGRTEAIAPATCPAGAPSCTPIAGITNRDPYAGITPPPEPATGSDCSGPAGSQTALPGAFDSGFSLASGTCTLSSGTYFVKGNFTVDAGASLNTDGGTVFIYLESGQFSITGKFSASADPTQNHGIVLWQAKGDNNALTTAAGANVHLNGIVYAPSAVFNVAKRVAMKGLVAQRLSFGNAPPGDPAYDISQIGRYTPTETSISPATIDRSDTVPTNATVTIAGSHFLDNPPPDVAFDDGITVNQVTFDNPNQLTVHITIPPGATLGATNFVITNNDEGRDIEEGALNLEALPKINSVTLANGGAAAGTIEAGDTITVVFSKPMKETSVCSSWLGGDGANQVLNTDDDVTVTATDAGGTTNDTMAITSAAVCDGAPAGFGTIDLGSPDYVIGAAETFNGAGAGASTVTWTAPDTLTITLGTQTAGVAPPAVATPSTPTYTAPPGVTDTRGGGLTPPTFTPNAPAILF